VHVKWIFPIEMPIIYLSFKYSLKLRIGDGILTLRDKTNQKFKDFFEKIARNNGGQEFELAFSEIQRETGAANTTMKRAIESLISEGWLDVKHGRNTRYGRFLVTSMQVQEPNPEEVSPSEEEKKSESSLIANALEIDASKIYTLINELENSIEGLRRRVRTQEMTIALLQDRVAEIEDKLYKR
jgi:DNA-binding MarR family transcriptional regulator